jgi:hypothetical protein
VVSVRERTIPTERPPLVGEVSANFCGQRVKRGQRDRTLRPCSWFSRPEPLVVPPSSSSVVLTRLRGPCSRPTTSQKIWYRRESNPDLWICSQELWPPDHRWGLPPSTLHCINSVRTFPLNLLSLDILVLSDVPGDFILNSIRMPKMCLKIFLHWLNPNP